MLLFILINIKSQNQAATDSVNQRVDSSNKNIPKQAFDTMSDQTLQASVSEPKLLFELNEAKKRIDILEKKIAFFEGRVPVKYPNVNYLGYKDRKRILVSITLLFSPSLNTLPRLNTQIHFNVKIDLLSLPHLHIKK